MRNKKLIVSALLAGCIVLAAAGITIMSNTRAAEIQAEYGDTFTTIDPVNAIIATAVMLIIGLIIYIKRNKIN